MSTMIMYNQAPLPFQGQKRRFLKQFKASLNDVQNVDKYIFVDLFGGSGLLSHTVKQLFAQSDVVWNDYDNYKQRIDNIERTNALLRDIRVIVSVCESDKRIPDAIKSQILTRVSQEEGFVDYVTLSANLLFSGQYVTTYKALEKQTFYNTVRKSDYSAEGYLDGVIRVSKDYKELHAQYKGLDNVIFLIDPPYLSTDCKSYSSDDYWKLGDYLDVLTTLQGSKYYYFTSNKSQVIELCQWMSSHSSYVNPFEGSVTTTTAGNVNYSSSYTDIMVCKVK